MTVQYTLMSHGEVLGYTGTPFPSDELPAGASVWRLVPTAAFDFVEPIIAELTAPPAIALVKGVIPTQAAYLDPARNEHEAQMEQLVHEAARIHHFRLVLERYEGLDLELREPNGRRVAATTLLVTKEMVSADALHAYLEAADPRDAHRVNMAEPCYLLVARLASALEAPMQSVASAA